MKLRLGLSSLFLAIMTMAPQALSIPLYLTASFNYDGKGGSGFIAYYDSVKAGVGDTMGCFSCNICHNGITPAAGNINTYATDWRTEWMTLEPARALDQPPDSFAVQAWHAVETTAASSATGDSDGDGVPNGQEIMAGSNPGDPSSTPTNPNAPSSCASGNTTMGSSANNPNLNLNALNTKCGFSSGAGLLKAKDDPSQVLEEMLLFLLPLFVFFYLKSRLAVRNKIGNRY